MRTSLPPYVVRVADGGSDAEHGPMCGAFTARMLLIISSGPVDDRPLAWGWEHVSVSRVDRCPTWDEMCFVRRLFFEPHETVVQYHPPEGDKINAHPFCLHLWRWTTGPFPMPPRHFV